MLGQQPSRRELAASIARVAGCVQHGGVATLSSLTAPESVASGTWKDQE